MKCILYFVLIASDKEVKSMPRYWFAEGFIWGDNMDLESILQAGNVLQNELQRRRIVNLSDSNCFYFEKDIYYKIAKVVDPSSRGYGGDAMVFNSSLVKQGRRSQADRICFQIKLRDFSPHSSPLDTQLSSIRSNVEAVFPENFFKPMVNVRALFFPAAYMSSLPSFIVCFGKTLKMLQLSICPSLESLPVQYLRTLEKLEVLDLAETSLEYMPDNLFEGLHSLRLLDLSDCEKLSSLPSSISLLLNLEMLLLGSCSKLSRLPSSLWLQKLQVLDLSKTSLAEIPEGFFFHVLELKNLNLSFNSKLKSLPVSISKLLKLEKLNIESCTNLLAVLPSLSPAIEELNLSECSSLQDTSQFSSSFEKMPNLRVLNLKATNLHFLTLKCCSNLESITLGPNTDIAALHLSGTKIDKFLLEGISKNKSLRRLDILGLKKLLKVDWKIVDWLPAQVNWDQCGGSKSYMHIPLEEWFRVGNGYGVFISVSNASIFRSLTHSSRLWSEALLRFVIYIHPCMKKSPPSVTSRYQDVYYKLQPHVPLYDRCLEIEGVGNLQKSIHGVLSHTNFLYLHDDKNLIRLSNLGVDNMGDLRECRLKRCHEMEVVLDIGHNDLPESKPLLNFLEKMQISELKKLHKVCTSVGILNDGSFSQLKHLQLEYCPQLVMVFSSGMCLKNLEVLEIKHCARLEEIFFGELHSEGSLQRLQTVLLLELPALNNIVRNVTLLSLKKAKIKRCPKLHRLPIAKNTSVYITGELQWWEQLQWNDNSGKHNVSFNAWRPFKLSTRT